jgi:quinol monooxygenase YgiN
MYGTIARVKIDPAKVEELQALGRRIGVAPGQIARYVYQMDANPGELFLVVVFESREAYWANARSHEQNQRFQEMRALMLADPEWHDGEIVDVVTL